MHDFVEHLRADETNSKRKYLYQEEKMLADGISSAEVERTTQKKGSHATMVRLLFVILFGGFFMLTYGYTKVHSDGLPAVRLAAQVDSPESAQLPTATPQQPTVTPQDLNEQVQSLSQDVELLRIKVESELEASKEGIEAMRDVNDRNYSVFVVITGVVGVFGLATLITTGRKGKQEHQDYEHERKFYEERAQRYEERRQAEHEAILQLYGEQFKAREEENKHAGRMFALQKANLEQVNNITTAIAAGATQNVKSLNTMLSTFQQIMEFKVAEAEGAQELFQNMKVQLDRWEEVQLRQVEELLQCAVRLRRPRFMYASPDPDLRFQIQDFRAQMDRIPREVLDEHTGAVSPEAENREYGEIYLRRGMIEYYENDIVKSREMLRISEKFFSFSKEEIENMSRDRRIPTAFTLYYLALIEKNYGEMRAALEYIEKSYEVHGQKQQNEVLTPTTRAEILSYLGHLDNARAAIEEVLDRAENLKQSGLLSRQDAIYALRARLFLGNTYYVEGEWDRALQHYEDALKADVRRDYSYYIHQSIAQVYHQLGDEKEAKENKRQVYKELVGTRHLQTKVALDTRILLNALAYLCTHEDEPETAKQYKEIAQELLLKIREVNGLQLHLFSFEQKRPIRKDKFLTEVFS